ncbi:hypothetical protein GINT2_002361 [Glugoides intestinalis]
MRFSIVLIASTLISCSVSTTENLKRFKTIQSKVKKLKTTQWSEEELETTQWSEEELETTQWSEEELETTQWSEEELERPRIVESNEEKLQTLKTIYENNIPTNESGWVTFANDIDPILNSVPLENSEVFNKFAPFLLYSVNHKDKLKDMDLRLVYESNNENIKEHWKNYTDKIVEPLRFSFNVDKINDVKISEELEFCNNFSKLPKLELSCSRGSSFKNSVIWNNLMEVLSKISIISISSDVEILLFDSVMLEDFIDSAAASKSKVLKNLNKLKIVFDNEFGIRYLNSAVKKFPSLFKPLSNLSEITIENQADIYRPSKDHKSGNLVNLINGLPKKIAIKLIGRFVESKQQRKFVNALKKRSRTGKVSMIYNLISFNRQDALELKHLMEDSKLDITIFGTRNGIERQLPKTIEFLDNLLKVEYFHIWFGHKYIKVNHTSVNDFSYLFSPFFQEWNWVIYTDKKLKTEIRKLPEVVETLKAFKTSKYISFKSKFLEISDENDMNSIISEVNEPYKRLVLYALVVLIDSVNLISIYNKMQENVNFTVEAKSWLIKVRKGNRDAFEGNFREIYKTLYPNRSDEDQFLLKIKVLNEISKLDAFTIDLRNNDVLCIGNGRFEHVFQMLQTIKIHFKKLTIPKKAFTEDQIEKLRDELERESSCTLEILPEESLLNFWLRSQ